MTSQLRISQAMCHLLLVTVAISILQMRKLRLEAISETMDPCYHFYYIKISDSVL